MVAAAAKVLLVVALGGVGLFADHAPAAAQTNAQVFVQANGNFSQDATCTYFDPCGGYAYATSKVISGGTVHIIGPYRFFGDLISTKTYSIVGSGAVNVNGGITVTSPSGTNMTFEGLRFEPVNSVSNGVRVLGAGKVTIRSSVFENFRGQPWR